VHRSKEPFKLFLQEGQLAAPHADLLEPLADHPLEVGPRGRARTLLLAQVGDQLLDLREREPD